MAAAVAGMPRYYLDAELCTSFPEEQPQGPWNSASQAGQRWMPHSYLHDSVIWSQATGILAGEDTGGSKIDHMSGRADSMLATLDGSHQVGKLLGEPVRLPSATTQGHERSS